MDDFDVVTGTPPRLQSLKPAVPPPRAEAAPPPAAMPGAKAETPRVIARSEATKPA